MAKKTLENYILCKGVKGRAFLNRHYKVPYRILGMNYHENSKMVYLVVRNLCLPSFYSDFEIGLSRRLVKDYEATNDQIRLASNIARGHLRRYTHSGLGAPEGSFISEHL